jgi:DNA-binding response OmpR family regulator
MQPHPSPRILVIDDDEGIRTSVSDWLHDQGYAVHAVATALDGLVSFLTKPPDLVILDIGLPDVNGITVLLLLRASTLPISRTVPVIIITAYDDTQLRSELYDHGADHVVSKPFTLSELHAIITRRIATLPATAPVATQSQSRFITLGSLPNNTPWHSGVNHHALVVRAVSTG